jgi:hypothetical protein
MGKRVKNCKFFLGVKVVHMEVQLARPIRNVTLNFIGPIKL